MAKKIYVGNLSYKTSEEDLQDLFNQYGTVNSATIIIDRDSNRSKGFGFVELEEEEGAQKAIEELDGKEFLGRNLRVNEAISRPRNNDRGGYRR
ncbi:MAG: RNA-binding protein [Sphaerochaetaceae bacterium]